MTYRTVEIPCVDRDRPITASGVRMNRIKLRAEPPTQRLDAILQGIDAETQQDRSTGEKVGVR